MKQFIQHPSSSNVDQDALIQFYRCKHCTYISGDIWECRKHMGKHTNNALQKCSECDFTGQTVHFYPVNVEIVHSGGAEATNFTRKGFLLAVH